MIPYKKPLKSNFQPAHTDWNYKITLKYLPETTEALPFLNIPRLHPKVY